MSKITYEEIKRKYKQACKVQKVSELSRDLFCKLTGVTKHAIAKYCGSFAELKASMCPSKVIKKCKSIGHFIPIYDNVTYNSDTSEYRFDFTNFKNIAKLITLPKSTVLAILQAYSPTSGEGLTAKEIANIQKLSVWVVKGILKVMGISHDDIPLPNDEIEKHSVEENINNLLDVRRGEIYDGLQKKVWQSEAEDAHKWRLFEALRLNPYKNTIKTWTPPKYVGPKQCKVKSNNSAYIISLSDIHFGAIANANETYYTDEDWNIESTKAAISNYVQSIDKHLSSLKELPTECIVLSLGDIIHTLSGFTEKGTKLEYDLKGPSLFKEALDSLTQVFYYLSSKFAKIHVKAVSGNHDAFGDWVLFNTLSVYFKDIKRITWDVSEEHWLDFSYGDNLFIMEHGYSPFYKAKVPKAASAKEAYIHRLILKASAKGSFKNNYFFMGDRHHFNCTSFPMFEFIQLPTCVGGDLYADHLNLAGTRNKQCTFIVDPKDGITATINHFL
jgi:hypothetical protein